MRALILILALSVSNFAQASTQFSDLSTKQQAGILKGLKKFLPLYKHALDIAIYNIELKAVGTMNENGPMSKIVLEEGTVQSLFSNVGRIVSRKVSMQNFGDKRGQQTFTQVNKEAAQADSLSFHVHHFHTYNDLGYNAKAWMKHMNSQVEVISADDDAAAVRLLHFPRKCTITANSNAQVYQHCN